MAVGIHTIALGFNNCYIIRGTNPGNAVIVDSGVPNRLRTFLKGLKRIYIAPGSIKLMVLTHGHWDHTGSAQDIKKATGAKAAIHERDKDLLEKPVKSLPPGVTLWGRIFIRIMSLFMPFVKIPPASADITLDDNDFSLDQFGVEGKIVSTPGHSPGSVSVLLDSGDAFVGGDLAMNAFPLRLTPGLPILAEDMEQVKKSWRLLLERGAKTVYPGHGKPFCADIIRDALYPLFKNPG
ncbi:MAG: MBL fold metallo-hydrolase [Desulfobacterales bacterium]